MKDLLPAGSTYFLCSMWGRDIGMSLPSEDILSIQSMGLSQNSLICRASLVLRLNLQRRWVGGKMECFHCVSLPFPSSHLVMVCIQLIESGASKALSPG